MKDVKKGVFHEERALFGSYDLLVADSEFDVGESALKHSRRVEADNVEFKGKYPVWYSSDVDIRNSTFTEGARAALWYTNNITLRDTAYRAVKGLRRCRGVSITDCEFTDAPETLWKCSDVRMKNVKFSGDYLCLDCDNVEIDGLTLNGKYCFDSCRNVTVRNSTMIGRDAFWNCENVTVADSVIRGEYIGWNTRKLTFINCTVESLQGLCYIDGLMMINCKLPNTTLAFEYSSVDADIDGSIESVIDPLCGVIRAESIGELIQNPDRADPKKTQIILKSK